MKTRALLAPIFSIPFEFSYCAPRSGDKTSVEIDEENGNEFQFLSQQVATFGERLKKPGVFHTTVLDMRIKQTRSKLNQSAGKVRFNKTGTPFTFTEK